MKKVLLVALLVSSGAMATQIAVKATTVNFDYMESDGGSNLDSERAGLGKIRGFEMSIRGGNGSFADCNNGVGFINNLDLSYNSGQTQYVGMPLGVPGAKYGDLISTTNNKLYEMTYRVGLSAPMTDNTAVGLTVGTGVRSWQRSLSDGNVETYFWGNFIAGGQLEWKTASWLKLSATADWQRAYKPSMDSTLIGASFNLGKTDGYKLGMHWASKLTQRLAFETDYIYDHWVINQSNSISDGSGGFYYEPHSVTNNQFLKMGFSYTF